ncbi:MAG TPA: ABC transporter permease [Allosphingosinicella sp.]|jgi:ABC-type multidrug transport system permease subunit
MMNQFFALIGADLRTFSRSRISVFWTFAFPLLILVAYMQLFANPKLGEVSLVVEDRDQSETSRDFAQSVVGVMSRQDVVSVKRVEPSPGDKLGKRTIQIVIPRNFGAVTASKGSMPVAVRAKDKSDPAIRASLGILQGVVTNWNMAAAGEPPRALLRVSAPDGAQASAQSRVNYLLAGLIVMVALSSSLMGFAVPLVASREHGLTRQQSLWPVGRGLILAAWAGSKLAVILTSALMLCAVAATFYGFGTGLSAAGILVGGVVLLTATCCLLSLGLAVASRSKSTQTALVMANSLYFVGLFTGDLLIPTGGLPEGLRQVLAFSPVNAFAQALRSALGAGDLREALSRDLWLALAVFLVLGAGAFTFASKTYRWSAR